MKTVVLALLVTCGTGVATETVAAHPTHVEFTSTSVEASHPGGFWGLFKGKKHKKPRPAYTRLR